VTAPLRRNAGPRAVARDLVCRCGWKKADARAVTGKKWRPSHASPRRALSSSAQRVLLRALETEPEAVARVLRLCLFLGLRIAEATRVTARSLRPGSLRVFGKGSKWRTVPLDVDPNGAAAVEGLPVRADITPARVQRACRRLAEAYPTLADLTPHVLRHTFATNALRRCVDPAKLQAALGHDKFSTTLTYLHTLEP
jgi:integrase/recombinase XerD